LIVQFTKTLENLAQHCQSYRKNKSGTFFMAHGVVAGQSV